LDGSGVANVDFVIVIGLNDSLVTNDAAVDIGDVNIFNLIKDIRDVNKDGVIIVINHVNLINDGCDVNVNVVDRVINDLELVKDLGDIDAESIDDANHGVHCRIQRDEVCSQ
jgi:hypothetical protein